MCKHTPGPWKSKERQEGICGSNEVLTESGKFICQMTHYPSREAQEQAKIDARLIAAAPDLLEALERVVKLTETEDAHLSCFGEFEAARAAIRKAKGE